MAAQPVTDEARQALHGEFGSLLNDVSRTGAYAQASAPSSASSATPRSARDYRAALFEQILLNEDLQDGWARDAGALRDALRLANEERDAQAGEAYRLSEAVADLQAQVALLREMRAAPSEQKSTDAQPPVPPIGDDAAAREAQLNVLREQVQRMWARENTLRVEQAAHLQMRLHAANAAAARYADRIDTMHAQLADRDERIAWLHVRVYEAKALLRRQAAAAAAADEDTRPSLESPAVPASGAASPLVGDEARVSTQRKADKALAKEAACHCACTDSHKGGFFKFDNFM